MKKPKSKGLMGVNRHGYSGRSSHPDIDLDRKWTEGSVLYNPETGELQLVRAVLPGHEVLALVEDADGVGLVGVHAPGTEGVIVWDYVGHIGGPLE